MFPFKFPLLFSVLFLAENELSPPPTVMKFYRIIREIRFDKLLANVTNVEKNIEIHQEE